MLPISMFINYLLVETVCCKWYQMLLLSAAIKCLRKLIKEFSVIKNEYKLTVVIGALRGLHLVIRVAAVTPLSWGVTIYALHKG